MKAYQNKDGSWYVRVYDKNTGKKSTVKGATKKEAIRAAGVWYAQTKPTTSITFGEALDQYISDRSASVSPSTYREYRRMQEKCFDDIASIPIENITSAVMQKFINDVASTPIVHWRGKVTGRTRSAKTVANIWGLASGVLSVYAEDRRFKVRLPKNSTPEPKMPSEDDVERLVNYLRDRDDPMYLPVLLALFVPCRRSEICALTTDDLDGNVLYIHSALVKDEKDQLVNKGTKSQRGTRRVLLPGFVADEIRKKDGKITELTPDAITCAFKRIRRKVGIQCRFHDLRHWADSYLHRMGLSDMEITSRAGHSPRVFRGVYLHPIGEDRAAEIFENFR